MHTQNKLQLSTTLYTDTQLVCATEKQQVSNNHAENAAYKFIYSINSTWNVYYVASCRILIQCGTTKKKKKTTRETPTKNQIK